MHVPHEHDRNVLRILRCQKSVVKPVLPYLWDVIPGWRDRRGDEAKGKGKGRTSNAKPGAQLVAGPWK